MSKEGKEEKGWREKGAKKGMECERDYKLETEAQMGKCHFRK